MTKKLLFFSLIIATSLAQAEYVCTSENGKMAHLQIKNYKSIFWHNVSESASSEGTYIGKDESPYSLRYGERKYILENFAKSESQKFVLSIPESSIHNLNKEIIVTEFLENDDHEEQEIAYNCKSNILTCRNSINAKVGHVEINSDSSLRADLEEASGILFIDSVLMSKKENVYTFDYNDDGYGGIYEGKLTKINDLVKLVFKSKSCSESYCGPLRKDNFICK